MLLRIAYLCLEFYEIRKKHPGNDRQHAYGEAQ